jgi:hypothetical protein
MYIKLLFLRIGVKRFELDMIAAGKKVFAAAPEMNKNIFYVIWNLFSFRNGWWSFVRYGGL